MTEQPVTATTADLQRLGWARSYTGFWLAPAGDRIIAEHDAITEIAELLDRPAVEQAPAR